MSLLSKDVLARMRDLDRKKKFVDDPEWTTERALALLDEHHRFKQIIAEVMKAGLDFADFALRELNKE